jgi:hypothetical protein
VSRRAAAVAICVLLPWTLAAADPRGDAVPCRGTHGGGDPPDLVDAVGWIGEEGSAAVWRLTFGGPLRVPDPTAPPFRVDVVIRDPHVPVLSFGDYERFNRIVRFDASSPGREVELLFLTEGGHTVFDPPMIDGDTMTIEMPGRLLLGTDRFGRVDLERLRWTVIVRDGGRCDLLGAGGAPTHRLEGGPPSSPTDQPTDTIGSFSGRQAAGLIIAALAVLVAIVVVAIVLKRRR